MDNQRKPRAREKKVVGSGKGVEIHGEGLGTGPVNNMGNYEDRKPHQTASPQAGRPSGSGFGSSFGQGASRPARPQSGSAPRPSGFQDPFRRPAGTSGSSRSGLPELTAVHPINGRQSFPEPGTSSHLPLRAAIVRLPAAAEPVQAAAES